MPELPSGTITFLFSDIEGSTPLWERNPRAMQVSLARHNAILQNSIERHNGQVFKVIGDAFQTAFTAPAEAVAAALEAQRALAGEAWSESGPIRVRMGIHSGPAEVREGDYLASHTLNRVARIMSAGHGGQILLSAAAADHVRGLLPEEVALKDLGEHFLKGLVQAEHIYQVMAPALPAEFSPLVTRITPKSYKLLEPIGEGGFGTVYRALHPDVGREVAVKIIRPALANQPEFIRRFEAEAQIVARLEHPRIVPLYDYWREPDGAFLVMRLLRGGSLEKLLEEGPFSLPQAAQLAGQMAEALAAAHAQGIVHRDLKPANILLDEAGNFYLSDFGIAKNIVLEGSPTRTSTFLGSPLYMAPEQMLGEAVGPETDLYSLGIVLFEALVGECPFPDDSTARLIDRQLHEPLPSASARRPDLPKAVDEVLGQVTAKAPEERFPDALSFAAAFQAALSGERLPAIGLKTQAGELANPYKGLRAFQEADAEDFYGREALVERLVSRLSVKEEASSANGHGPGHGRFLAVVGPSGSGKSSVVKAGLIPALRAGRIAGSEKWFVVEMLPGTHPLEELEAALLRVAVNPPASLLAQLQEDERGLVRAVKRALPGGEDAELLLVIDQFEETFTLVEDRGEARFFLDSLVAAVSDPRGQVRVAITLRADFYDRPLMIPEFSQLVQAGTEVVVPLTAEELIRAIQEPALRVGGRFEEGLIPRIVIEVNEQPGALPLLQYALTELFERRDGDLLSKAGYEQIGGVLGALSRRAEEVFQGLDENGQTTARQVFLRLVTLGEGVEDTRRRVLRSELEALEGLRDRGKGSVDSVLEAFGKARLLSFDRDLQTRGPTVEVAHEALLREWQRLKGWLEESRADVRLQRQLGQLANDWRAAGQDSSFLLRGSRLALFETWKGETPIALTRTELEYLEVSLAEREARRVEEAARQAREAALERRSRNFLRGLVAVFAVATVVAIVLSLFAFNQQRIARQNEALAGRNAATAVAAQGEAEQLASLRSREAQVNQSLALAAQSRLALQADNLDLALALAMEANRIPDPPGQSQVALSEAAYAPGAMRVFLGHQAPLWSVAVSPDGRYGLSGDDAGVIFLWDLESGAALRRLEGHQGQVSSLAFTPDGRHAVSASQDKTLVYWDLETGEILRRLEGHQTGVNAVAVSPDGRLAASGSGRPYAEPTYPYSTEDNSIRLWELRSGQEIRRFEFFTDGVTGVDFTPDGRALAVATVSDGFVLLDVETKKILVRPEVFWLDMAEVVISPDGLLALTSPYDKVMVWDLQTGEATWELAGHNSNVNGLAISPDGRRALGGSNTLIEWDLATGEESQRFTWGANAIAYLPDGKAALTGSDDHTLRLLALGSGPEVGNLSDPDDGCWVRSVAYSPDGSTALTATDCLLSLWDLETGNILWSESPRFDEVAFSLDGKQVLVSEFDFVTLRDARTGQVLLRLESDGSFEGHNTVDAVAFHPSGKFALTGAQHGTRLIYWDLETGKPVWLAERDTNVLGVAISPDGRTALSAEMDGSVNWWDLQTGQLLKRLPGHTNLVWGVAFVDDRTAISTSDDRTLILWDLESGAVLRTFLGHSDGVKRVAVSPDKRLALSAARDGTAILWDLQTGEPLRRYAGHEAQLRTVAFHPDGAEALTGSQDNQAIRWRVDADLESFLAWVGGNRYVRALTCAEREVFHAEPLCSASTAAEEPVEAAAPVPMTAEALLPPLPTPTPLPPAPEPADVAPEKAGTAIRGVNLGSIPAGGGQTWEYAGMAGEKLSIRAAAASPGDSVRTVARRAELGLLDTTLAIYAPDGSLLAQADDLENSVATDAYLAALTLPESGTYRIEVRSYRDQTGGDYRLVIGDPRPLFYDLKIPATAGLAIHPDGRTALMGAGYFVWPSGHPPADDNRIWVWDLERGEVVRRLEGHPNTPVAIAISADGRRALSADLDGVAILWDLERWAEIRRFDNAGQTFSGIVFHPDGQTFLTSSFDTILARWDLESGEVLQRFEGHTGVVQDLATSPDGETLYSASEDATVRVWEVSTGKLLATYRPLDEYDFMLFAVAVSPDGGRILVGGGNFGSDYGPEQARIVMLDASTGEKLQELVGHTTLINSIAFSPDGRYALSSSEDQTVRLWEVGTGEQLVVFTGHTGWVWEVAFSPDGLTGYSTSIDGTFRVWDLREFIGAGGG